MNPNVYLSLSLPLSLPSLSRTHSLPGQTHLLSRVQSSGLSYAAEELLQGEIVTAGLLLTDGASCTIEEVVANVSIVAPETSG